MTSLTTRNKFVQRFEKAVSKFSSMKLLDKLIGNLDGRTMRLLSIAVFRFSSEEHAQFDKDLEEIEKFADGLLPSFPIYANDNFYSHCFASIHPIFQIKFYSSQFFEFNKTKVKLNSFGRIAANAKGAGMKFHNSWRSETVEQLAKTIYQSKDFSLMPILADALQDGNCTDEALLSILRDPQEKWYKGNWIIDTILNKR